MKNTNLYLIGGAAVVTIGATLLMSGSSKKSDTKLGDETFNDNTGSNTPAPAPTPTYTPPTTTTPPLNINLVLLKGSKGNEVKALQKLLGITADGIFGSQTETALFKKKGVLKISLSQYSTMPNFNQNSYPAGSKVMSNNKAGAKLYHNKTLVDGTNMSTGEVFTTVDFGEAVGVIKAASSGYNWYRVEFDAWSGKVMCWVKAVDVKKY